MQCHEPDRAGCNAVPAKPARHSKSETQDDQRDVAQEECKVGTRDMCQRMVSSGKRPTTSLQRLLSPSKKIRYGSCEIPGARAPTRWSCKGRARPVRCS